jgi:predicted dehydrogenase
VGARRARQGLGPFLARDLYAAGAEVPCFTVSKHASLAEAELQLSRTAGVRARGYTDLPTLLADERLDALVVCSPHETHAAALETAAEAGLHTLCEKPLVWGEPELAARAASLIGLFETRGLILWENCQWPYTLPAFERLHPGSTKKTPRRFSMLLQPAAVGERMLADSLPHALSLLQRLVPDPDPELTDVDFSSTDPETTSVMVRFVYRTGDSDVECAVELRPSLGHPRKVHLALDDHWAQRRVRSPDYQLSLDDGGRSVPLEDPMSQLVASFVGAVRGERNGAAGPSGQEIVARMALLEQLRDAWKRAST